MGIRSKKRLITLGYVIGSTALLALIAGGSGSEGATVFFGFLIIINLIASYWITRYLHKSLIAVAQCSSCGTMLDLVGKWKCTCGYVAQRHVFDKCKNCKGTFGYIPCPKCEVAIDI
ncbi:MAG: hypothetical protein WBD99_02060 [Thermodesulfobacteriota bacterium]